MTVPLNDILVNFLYALVFYTAVFRLLTSDPGEITMTVGGIQLHLVFGDITRETTDAIVNTTDFQNFESGMHRHWDMDEKLYSVTLNC